MLTVCFLLLWLYSLVSVKNRFPQILHLQSSDILWTSFMCRLSEHGASILSQTWHLFFSFSTTFSLCCFGLSSRELFASFCFPRLGLLKRADVTLLVDLWQRFMCSSISSGTVTKGHLTHLADILMLTARSSNSDWQDSFFCNHPNKLNDFTF